MHLVNDRSTNRLLYFLLLLHRDGETHASVMHYTQVETAVRGCNRPFGTVGHVTDNF